MPELDRRRFLQVAGGAATATMLSETVARAAALPTNTSAPCSASVVSGTRTPRPSRAPSPSGTEPTAGTRCCPSDPSGSISVVVSAQRAATLVLVDALASRPTKRVLTPARGHHQFHVPTRETDGWYDLTLTVEDTSFTRQFAGHVETGKPSVSNPLLGR